MLILPANAQHGWPRKPLGSAFFRAETGCNEFISHETATKPDICRHAYR